MAKYKVEQVDGGDYKSAQGSRVRRSQTVDESQVEGTRQQMRADARSNPNHSSDVVRVTKQGR